MHAVCVRCGGSAHYSQRIAGGNSQVEVGDTTYEARCRACYEIYKAEAEKGDVVQLKMPTEAPAPAILMTTVTRDE
jgi:hypothetical protein